MRHHTMTENAQIMQNNNIQDIFLAQLCEKKVLVSIYLVNGVRLQGYVKSFDSHVIYLDDPVSQIVYKRSICSIMQAQDARAAR